MLNWFWTAKQTPDTGENNRISDVPTESEVPPGTRLSEVPLGTRLSEVKCSFAHRFDGYVLYANGEHETNSYSIEHSPVINVSIRSHDITFIFDLSQYTELINPSP
jgi:hypothetical protein